jgi:hypothetical protein
MIKKLFFLAVLFIASHGFVTAQEYPGASLVDSIDLGVSSSIVYNFSAHNDTIYISLYDDNSLLKFSTINHEVVTGYPVSLANGNGIHGNYVDNNDTLWVFDLNNSRVNKYAPDHTYIESITVGGEPVNGIEVNGDLYVADRLNQSVYIIKMETGVVTGSFSVDAMTGIATVGTIDLFYYSDKIFMVSDQFDGVLKMDLDGTNQELIETDKSYYGIFIRNDTIFLAGEGIDIIDMNGNIINQWSTTDDGLEYVMDLYIRHNYVYVTSDAFISNNIMLVYDLPSNQAEIQTYTVPGATNVEFIDVGVATRIEIAVPEGTDLTNLTPTFTLSEGATAYNSQTMEEEISGVDSHDFSTYAVGYIVEAEDGTQNTYAVYVYEEGVVYEMDLISYTIPGQLTNELDQENNTIDITVPQGTDLTSLIADFEVSYGASLMLVTNPATYEMIPQISGETVNDFTDTLTLTVFNHLMNDMTDYEIVVTLVDPTDINSLSVSESFVIYPNPVKNFVNIALANESNYEIVFYDMTGKILVKQVINKQKNDQIDLSDLKSGIYTVKIQIKDEIFTTKIMKQ